jgi:hypothetical protein
MRELIWFPMYERWPVTSGYGSRIDPITGAASSFHRGVDYGAPYGEPVIAPFDGQITVGSEPNGAGNWLWCVNGSDMFKSFHHDGYAVTSGWVNAGTEIAYIGSTGASTGAHAHLELWEGGTNIDPTGYLDRAPLIGGQTGNEDDEMTDEDWNTMRGMLNTAIVGKMAVHSDQRALISGPGGQYFVTVDGDGKLVKTGFRSPDEVNLLKRIGFLAQNKPEHPPTASPPAIEESSLTDGERRALNEIPWA